MEGKLLVKGRSLKPQELPWWLSPWWLGQWVSHRVVPSPSRTGIRGRPSGYFILINMQVKENVDLGFGSDFKVVSEEAGEE